MSFIILDRDGVINHESSEYIKSPEEWQPISGSLEAITKLNKQGFKVFVVTNQSGIGRGYFDIKMLESIHEKLMQALSAIGGNIEEFFFCPHHPNAGCCCRKPKTGMIEQIQKKYPIDITQTFFIGDSWVDMKAAELAGCLPILVLTGKGQQSLLEYPTLSAIPHFTNLAQAVDYVLSKHRQYAS
jgi:D-glycero-D-manno-heptose 1,7-bisphosphate phosphatase